MGKSEEEEDVELDVIWRHALGYNGECIVCRHLVGMSGKGFIVPDEQLENPEQAWCFNCESFRESEGGWTIEVLSFADFRSVSEDCFKKVASRNKLFSGESASE